MCYWHWMPDSSQGSIIVRYIFRPQAWIQVSKSSARHRMQSRLRSSISINRTPMRYPPSIRWQYTTLPNKLMRRAFLSSGSDMASMQSCPGTSAFGTHTPIPFSERSIESPLIYASPAERSCTGNARIVRETRRASLRKCIAIGREKRKVSSNKGCFKEYILLQLGN